MPRARMDKSVVMIGALDSKGAEFTFLRQILLGRGMTVVVVDTGVMEHAHAFPVDVSADVVARAGGGDIESIRRSNQGRDRGDHCRDPRTLRRARAGDRGRGAGREPRCDRPLVPAGPFPSRKTPSSFSNGLTTCTASTAHPAWSASPWRLPSSSTCGGSKRSIFGSAASNSQARPAYNPVSDPRRTPRFETCPRRGVAGGRSPAAGSRGPY
jgi:hypothetical protein